MNPFSLKDEYSVNRSIRDIKKISHLKSILSISGVLLAVVAVVLLYKNSSNEEYVLKDGVQKHNDTQRIKHLNLDEEIHPQIHEAYSEPVTLESISALSSPADTSEFFCRIVVELLNELTLLEEASDRSRITSRLKPIVEKMYHLKKVSAKGSEQQTRLPVGFQVRIDQLEKLWTNNPHLATAVDDLFHNLDLLEDEHLPYQLRNKLQPR